MSEIIPGQIEYYQNGNLLIWAKYENSERFIKRKYDKVRIELVDGRPLSEKQRRMCYALINAISDWSGDETEAVKYDTKFRYRKQQLMESDAESIEDFGEFLFSLSNAPMDVVRGYQKYLVWFVIYHDVPIKRPLYEYVDDINDYVNQCLLHKKCAVCGRYAELHHIDAVGMGNDRKEIVHEGMEVISLCREHHTEAHKIGNKDFMARYHFNGGIQADKSICKLYGLKEKKK